jgi:plastocyanin
VLRQRATVFSILVFVTCCGGGNGPATGPDSARSEPIVNVTARGFEPPGVVVAVGGRVRFQNFDDRPHSIASNPVDTHTDCPGINEVGLLVPGQVKATAAFRDFQEIESQNWFMGAGEREGLGGRLLVHTMISLEPFTIQPLGSPQVFQTGETYRQAPLIDYQHPHDLFMGLSV